MEKLSVLSDMKTDRGRDLKQASFDSPVLLVFLRHFGCVFCREAMTDIGQKISDWQLKGIDVILVHMSEIEIARSYFKKYGIEYIENISDPTCGLYNSFGLGKGNISQLIGLRSFIRGFEVTLKGITPGFNFIGDGFQMPGVFLLEKGLIVESYIHKTSADRPDYDKIISCCTI